MNKKTHMAGGALAITALAKSLDMDITVSMLCASTFGAILPDIDHHNSFLTSKFLIIKKKWFQKLFFSVVAMGLLALIITKSLDRDKTIAIGAMIIYLIFTVISKHREYTHSLLALFNVYVIARLLENHMVASFIIPFIVGIASHLLLDMLNPTGIRLFYPFNKRVRIGGVIETGSTLEHVLFISQIFVLGMLLNIV